MIGIILVVVGYLLTIGLSSSIVVAVVNAYKHHFTSTYAHFLFSFIVAAVFGLWVSFTAFRANPTMIEISVPTIIAASQLIFKTMEAWMDKKGDVTAKDVDTAKQEGAAEEQQVANLGGEGQPAAA